MTDKSITHPLSQVTTYQTGAAQASTHRILQKYCDDVLRQYGLTKMHWLILGVVLDAQDGHVRLTDLSSTLGTTLSYITTAVNLLESKNILVRAGNGRDNRSKLISINKDFGPQCAIIENQLRESLRRSIYAKISPEDFRVYTKVLFQLSTLK